LQYNFEKDVRKTLYEPMKRLLQQPGVEQATHCANQTKLVLKSFEKFI